MSRVAAWCGLALGVLVFISGIPALLKGDTVFGLIAAAGLFVAGWSSLRGRTWGKLVLCAVGLVVLARALPEYFRSYAVWPHLPVILFSTLTLGFAVVGLLLDRFHRSTSRS